MLLDGGTPSFAKLSASKKMLGWHTERNINSYCIPLYNNAMVGKRNSTTGYKLFALS